MNQIILTSEDPDRVDNYLKTHDIQIEKWSKFYHPKFAEDVAKEIIDSGKNWIVYDTVVLDYIEPDKVYFVDDNNELVLASEYDKIKKRLNYMYLGEAILNSGFLDSVK